MSHADSVNVYDFDHTIYHGDASLDFIIYCMRRKPRTWRRLPLSGIAVVKYVFARATRKQVKQAAFAFLRDMTDLDTVVQNFWDTHESKIKPWYLERKHSSDLIVSASPEFLLRPIAERLGIAPPIATLMDTRTGQIIGKNCRADEKVRRLRAYDPSIEIANCYSDSPSDLPLLKLADKAYMVKKHTLVELSHDSMK